MEATELWKHPFTQAFLKATPVDDAENSDRRLSIVDCEESF